MFLVTGHGQRMHTFAVVVDTCKADEALRSACDAWNKSHSPNKPYELVSNDNGDYLLFDAKDCEDSNPEFVPRYGFVMNVHGVAPGQVVDILD